ncbi:MAG: HAD family hydrolase [Chloroflexi bacterium]|nr:HAD family hydrolase [Chloroflexota bacterium]
MIDTIVFDVDGVLWDAATAYNRCTQYVVERECLAMGLPEPHITLDDIMAFKRVGGFNSDWDLSWTLVVLCIARAQGRIPAPKSWPELAAESRGEGVGWAQDYVKSEAPSFHALQERFNAIYWGADRYPAIYDSPPSLIHRPGFAVAEKPFIAPDFMPRLTEAGVRGVGILTGRNRNEMRPPLAQIDFGGLLHPDAIFTAEHGSKPAPHLLARLLRILQAQTAVMVGDSIDDLRTALGYRQLATAQKTASVFAVQVAAADEHSYWRQAGADAAIADINQLPNLLANGQWLSPHH